MITGHVENYALMVLISVTEMLLTESHQLVSGQEIIVTQGVHIKHSQDFVLLLEILQLGI
jgi:hypothetical protein